MREDDLRDHPSPREKKVKKGQSLRDLCSHSQRARTCVTGVPGGGETEAVGQKKG